MSTDVSNLMLDRAEGSKLRIGVLCINLDSNSYGSMETCVVQTPGAHVVDNIDRLTVPRQAMRMLEPFQYRICAIDFDEGFEESCRLAARLRDSCDSSVALFAVSSDGNPDNIIAAMRSGCSEYLVKPLDPERIGDAVSHVEARRHIKEEGTSAGRIVTVLGSKGGTGVTSLATHLALNLVLRHNQKCLLVDQHLCLGDASFYLGLTRHQYSFYELVDNTDRLDNELLQGFLLQHKSGLHVLDSPDSINHGPQPSPEAVEHTLGFLAENYQFIIVDCPPWTREDCLATIRQSDQLALVVVPELSAIRNAQRWIDYLTAMRYPESCIAIVLNRYSKSDSISDASIEAALRRKISLKIPDQHMEFVGAINSGIPVVDNPKSSLPGVFDKWADLLIAREIQTEKKPSGRLSWMNLFHR